MRVIRPDRPVYECLCGHPNRLVLVSWPKPQGGCYDGVLAVRCAACGKEIDRATYQRLTKGYAESRA